jgi:hypothetical protein
MNKWGKKNSKENKNRKVCGNSEGGGKNSKVGR